MKNISLRSLLLSIAFTCLVSPSVYAESSNPAKGLVLDIPALRKVIGDPPEIGSKSLQRDLDILFWLQKSRNPSGVRNAWTYLDKVMTVFEPALGSDFSKTAPKIKQKLPQFIKLVNNVKDTFKKEISRDRPFVAYSTIKPCLPLEDSKSYPSGHASWYTTASYLLADLFPQRREPLLLTGRQGIYARPFCGLHYPSDVEAGHRLGKAAAQQIIRSSQWAKFKLSVQQEVKRALNPPPAGLPLINY